LNFYTPVSGMDIVVVSDLKKNIGGSADLVKLEEGMERWIHAIDFTKSTF